MIEAEAREAAARERAQRVKHSFTNVAEVLFTDKLAHERRGKRAERDFRSDFIPAWGERPIGRPGRCVGDRQCQEAPCAGNGESVVDLGRPFFHLGSPAGLWPHHVTMQWADQEEGRWRDDPAQPTPQRRRDVRILASHRADG